MMLFAHSPFLIGHFGSALIHRTQYGTPSKLGLSGIADRRRLPDWMIGRRPIVQNEQSVMINVLHKVAPDRC